MTNIREFKRPTPKLEQTAYEFGHGRIGKCPDMDNVTAHWDYAETVAHYLADAVDSGELDDLDVLDALATAGYKLVPLAANEPNVSSWAYWLGQQQDKNNAV